MTTLTFGLSSFLSTTCRANIIECLPILNVIPRPGNYNIWTLIDKKFGKNVSQNQNQPPRIFNEIMNKGQAFLFASVIKRASAIMCSWVRSAFMLAYSAGYVTLLK